MILRIFLVKRPHLLLILTNSMLKIHKRNNLAIKTRFFFSKILLYQKKINEVVIVYQKKNFNNIGEKSEQNNPVSI